MMRLLIFTKWFFKPEIDFFKGIKIKISLSLKPKFFFINDFIKDEIKIIVRYEN